MDTNYLMNVEGACQFLGGISRSSLYNLIRQGRVKRVKIGRRTMFRQSELERLTN